MFRQHIFVGLSLIICVDLIVGIWLATLKLEDCGRDAGFQLLFFDGFSLAGQPHSTILGIRWGERNGESDNGK